MENITVYDNFTTQAIAIENVTEASKRTEFACKNFDLIMNLVAKFILVGLGCVGNTLSVAHIKLS